MDKIKVLFVCIHNSARSQMAEAIINHYYGDRCIAESAGFEAGTLNPFAVKAMAEWDIDISQNKTDIVFDLFKEGRIYSYVITVCDESNAERCPAFPGITKRLHWSFPDPSAFKGRDEDKMLFAQNVLDQIKEKIDEWVKNLQS
ncbi:MAG TPA: arsenate reductase ArsC [Ignavibacteria bacterium]|nr:arsenate reductase ArsC [Ignavibacteria bacterium]